MLRIFQKLFHQTSANKKEYKFEMFFFIHFFLLDIQIFSTFLRRTFMKTREGEEMW